jgi:hypothetical protein
MTLCFGQKEFFFCQKTFIPNFKTRIVFLWVNRYLIWHWGWMVEVEGKWIHWDWG